MPTLRALTAAALLWGAVATPAAADSIAYVSDGNVYLATPDGASTVAVTRTGGYASVSQADDGRLLALHGKRFHLLNRWGDVLADFTPVGDGTAGSITLSGPFDPAISPDGTRVAYGFYVQYKSGDPNCGRPGGCQVGQLYTGTGYSPATGPAEWSAEGFRPQYSWTDPSWIDASRTLLSSPTSSLVKESAIDIAGDGADAADWFSEGAVGNLGDGEMNRQGRAVAFVGNTQGDRLLVYRLSAHVDDGGIPQGCLDAPAAGKAWSSPSWSPDGQRLAFAGAQGIYVAELPGIGEACPDAAQVAVSAFAPGGTSPDWGPADLPGPRPSASAPLPAPTSDTPAPTSTPMSTRDPAPLQASPSMTVAKASLRHALRRGLLARVPCSGSQRVRVTAKSGKRTVGSGKAACRAGAASVIIKWTTAGRRYLRSRKTATLVLASVGARPVKVTLR